MPRRFHRFAATGAALLLLTTACTAPGQTAPSAAGSPDPASAPSGSITVWGWNPDAAQADSWVEAFEKENPTIDVEYRFIQFSDYLNTLRLGLTSDSGPDVFGLQVGAMTDQFAPLAADLGPELDRRMGDGWKDDYLAAEQLNVEGRQVGLPWMVTGAGTIEVNKTLLDSVGAKVPTTIDEWVEVCAQLKGAGKKCLVQGAKDGWQNIDVFQALANQAARGHFYEAMNKKKPFDSPEMISAFEAWKSLFDKGVIQEGAFATTAYPDAADAFRTGEAGMIAFGTWQNSDMTKTRLANYATQYGQPGLSDTEFQIVPFPSVVNPTAQPELVLAGGPDVGWAVSAKSSNPAAAAAFVSWLASSKTSQGRMASDMQQPALKSVAIDTADVLTPAQADLVLAQAPALDNMAGPRQLANADVQAALTDALAAVGTGSMTAADAAAAVQRAIDAAA